MVRRANFGAGIALGVGIGAALGVAFHNLAMGVAIGAALGVALGMFWNLGKKGVAQCGASTEAHAEPASPSEPSPRS
jgi:hypothetical protein